MTLVLAIASFMQALAWVPIGVFFFRRWRERRNPISLALCLTTAYAAWSGAVPYWLARPRVGSWVGWALLIANALTVTLAHVSLLWAKKKFVGARPRDQSPPSASA